MTSGSALSRTTRSVMVVEDDREIAAILRDLFESCDFAITTAENGVEALDLLRSQPKPDAILLDLRMPVMDGAEFRKHQRADPELRDIPVIVTSAEAELQSQKSQLDVTNCLQKPYDADVLLETVQRVCGSP